MENLFVIVEAKATHSQRCIDMYLFVKIPYGTRFSTEVGSDAGYM